MLDSVVVLNHGEENVHEEEVVSHSGKDEEDYRPVVFDFIHAVEETGSTVDDLKNLIEAVVDVLEFGKGEAEGQPAGDGFSEHN